MLSSQEAHLSASNSSSASPSPISSESDTTPSPSPRLSIKTRFARQKKSKQSIQKSLTPTPKKKKKTILIFLKSPRSKSTRSLFNKSKNRRNKFNKSNNTNNIVINKLNSMATSNVNINAIKAQFEQQNNYNYNNKQINITHHNHKNNNKRYSVQQPMSQYKRNLNHRNHKNNLNNNPISNYNNYNKPPSPHSPAMGANIHHRGHKGHNKSKSQILPHGHQFNMNNNDNNITNKYTGICPYCNKEMPLLKFLTVKNKNSILTELRDKLQTVELLASLLKQQILQEQSRSTLLKGGSDTNLKRDAQKSVSNPYQADVVSSNYDLKNLTSSQQLSLQLLTKHSNVTFPIQGTAMISPQENISYFEKFKEMRKKYLNQDFFVRLDSNHYTFTVHTKLKSNLNKSKDSARKQYRQSRSFNSLNGAEFESAKDNVLKIWFKNTRGYWLMSFASETEANTILNLVNIIVNNSKYNQALQNQLIWAGYIQKKGKRVGLYSQKFLCLINLEVKIYKSHINWKNGEDPSFRFSLMDCDLSRDKKEVKFKKRNDKDKDVVFLAIKLSSEVERDDFLNLCAETLGKAIAKGRMLIKSIPSSPNIKNGLQLIPLSPSNPNNNDNIQNGNDYDDYESDMDENSAYFDDLDLKDEYSQTNLDLDIELPYLKSMTLHHKTPMGTAANGRRIPIDNHKKYAKYLEKLNNTPRMYAASSLKALRRLAKKRPSDIDFIETTFSGNEIVLKQSSDEYLKTYQLLDVLGKSMISGAFINKSQLYVHKAIWEQNKVMVYNYDEKLEIFGLMKNSLDKLFNDINIDWLKINFKLNSKKFHNKLLICEKSLRESQSSLTNFLNKSDISNKNKKKGGLSKFVGKLQQKTQIKVFDNQPYRDLIFKICGHASSIELYYRYLIKPNSDDSIRKQLLKDIQGITLCMMSFGRVIVGDMKEFLFAYLRRGAKNIYKYEHLDQQ